MARDTVVYTAGAFDMFHVGHLNLLRMAKGLGTRLIVAVSTDEVLEQYKPGKVVMQYEDRFQIVSAIKYVDVCIPQRNRDKLAAWEALKFDVLAIGDDWKGSADYLRYEESLAEVGVKTIYLPYTGSVSSSLLRKKLETAESR